jgi:type I restriction enzyme S subunit
MSELPLGWALSCVGELGGYINGRGFGKAEWSTSGRPIIRIQNLTGSGSSFNYFDGPIEERYIVPTGSLLVSWAATLGVYRWNGPEGVLNQHIFRVRSFIEERFHRYLLEHALGLMQGSTHGSGMVHITRSRFDETPVSLPPLAEQERIVAAIEEAFSKLDAGEAGLRTVRQLLKRMRDAILTAAVTGRLVPQDPTDTPAPKLLADARADEIAVPTGEWRPEGWAWTLLGSVAAIGGGIQKQPKRSPVRNRVPFLRVANVGRGRLDLSEVHEIEVFDGELDRYGLVAGDLLVVEGNGSPDQIGRSALWRGEINPCVHQNHLIRVRPGRVLEPAFLELYWNSPSAARRVQAVASSTSGLHTLSTGKLKTLPVVVPPPSEQLRIVAEVERQFSFIDACERAVDAGLARSAALRRSVLKAAFEGRLVPQDLSDEPASVLLERIRAERTAAPGQQGKRKKKAEAS